MYTVSSFTQHLWHLGSVESVRVALKNCAGSSLISFSSILILFACGWCSVSFSRVLLLLFFVFCHENERMKNKNHELSSGT
jgi:hypothetical protein